MCTKRKKPVGAFSVVVSTTCAVIQSLDMETDDFFSLLLGSPLRARAIRLFLNSEHATFTVDDITKRVHGMRSHVERELKALAKLGIIVSKTDNLSGGTDEGKAEYEEWGVDKNCRHIQALRRFSRDSRGSLGEGILEKLRSVGRLKFVALSRDILDPILDLARIDMVIVGEALSEGRIQQALHESDAEWGREIRYAMFSTKEFKYRIDVQDRLIRDFLDYPHKIILDKLSL